MSKRVRITAIVTTLCLCLSMFVVGVLSATTATLNVTSTLKFKAVSAIEYIQWNPVDDYYYIEMGELADGAPLEWRLVLERTGSEIDPADSTVDSIIDDNFTGNKTELIGKTYYFLLNTKEAGEECMYNNNTFEGEYGIWNKDYSYNFEEGTGDVYGNDYATSTIRQYLTGESVLRGCTAEADNYYNYSPALANGQTKPDDFLTNFKILDSEIYNLIDGRSLLDLYSKNGGSFLYDNSNAAEDNYRNPVDVTYNQNVENGIGGEKISSSISDKLWLLSCYEVCSISDSIYIDDDWDQYWWWLRSNQDNYFVNNPESPYQMFEGGLVDTVGYEVGCGYYTCSYDTSLDYFFRARPAFQMSF